MRREGAGLVVGVPVYNIGREEGPGLVGVVGLAWTAGPGEKKRGHGGLGVTTPTSKKGGTI